MGAARQVTGSKHIIEANGKKILLDCGFFQGKRKESFEKNKTLPFNPAEIDAVILSHAHIDHSGSLPTLVKNGFGGKIYCTPATADITAVMLLDSAHIQEQDAAFFDKYHQKTALKPIEPIYTEEDALRTAQLFRPVALHEEFAIADGIKARFSDAGHVLGSEIVELFITEDGKTRTVVFTGDLGRKNRNILRDPEQVLAADILITESTYGGRIHPDNRQNRTRLGEVIQNTLKKGGKLIIPSFALERTQEIVFDLNMLLLAGAITKIPIYIDSPLASKVTELFSKHKECFDEETEKVFLDNGINPFENVIFTPTAEESKAINNHSGPCIVVSASGMCEAGRIRHHLRNSVEDPRNTILIVGFQAEHTLGRCIVEKRKFIKIFDEMYTLRADVEIINGFSGHADKNELLEFATGIKGLKNIFVVHGEESQSTQFAESLRGVHPEAKIEIPAEGTVFEV